MDEAESRAMTPTEYAEYLLLPPEMTSEHNDMRAEITRLRQYCRIKDEQIRKLQAQTRARGLHIYHLQRTHASLRRQLWPLYMKVNQQKSLIIDLFRALGFYEDVTTWDEEKNYRGNPHAEHAAERAVSRAAATLPAVRQDD